MLAGGCLRPQPLLRLVQEERFILALRAALRSVYRDKPFVFSAVSILALGIGINLAFLAVLKANLYRRPPHVAQPERLFELSFDQTSFSGTPVRLERTSYPLFEHIREALGNTADVACEYRASVGFGTGEFSQEVEATLVSEDYFRILGVEPALGRSFSKEEHEWSAAGGRVAMLDYNFWKSAFPNAMPDERLKAAVADQPHNVVGVLPEGFRGIARKPSEIWLPLENAIGLAYPFEKSSLEIIADPDQRLFKIFVRPREGQSAAAIRSILRGVLVGPGAFSLMDREILEVHLEVNSSSQLARFAERMLRWGSLMALLTLAAACANVAALGLFRGLRRSQRTLIQTQLGATSGLIFRQTLGEGLVLSATATLAALGLFFGIAAALEKSMNLPPLALPNLSGGWAAAVLAAVVLAVMCATAMPTGLQAVRLGSPASLNRHRLPFFQKSGGLKSVLVFIQVAVAACLLAQTDLFRRSLLEAEDGLGFAPGNLVMLEVPNLRKLGHSEASIKQLFDEVEERARSLPGVLSTATATSGPFRKFQVTSLRGPDGQLPKLGEGVYLTGISEGYVPSLGLTLAAGRAFTEEDFSASEKVAMLNQRLAKLIWGERSPVGDCVYVSRDSECRRVVGVLDDHRIETSVFAPPKLQCYLPLTQYGEAGFHRAGDYMFARVADGLVSKVIQQLRAAPTTPHYIYATEVDAFVEDEMGSMNAALTILGLLGLAAVAVTAVGIFAQTAFWVHSRKRELGIRLALGAQPSRMLRTVSSQCARPVAGGLTIGLLASVPISDLARSYFFGLSAWGLDSMAAIALIVLFVAALACFVPCLRTLRLDPVETLRTE